MARVKINIGMVLSSRGDYDQAITNFEDSIELAGDAGDLRQKGYALAGAAHVYIMNRETDIAMDYLEEALQIFSTLGEQFKIALINLDYGRFYIQTKQKKKALRSMKRCLEIMEEMKLPFYTEKYRSEIVKILRSNGMKKEAEKLSS
jgi:tetratricopeptide (TPR) repeat protein